MENIKQKLDDDSGNDNIKRRVKIIIAYDGENYSGWQIQNNARTVQEEIIKACKKIFREDTNVIGASRTDAGVHAFGQVAVLEIKSNIDTIRIPYALNAHLPKDIVVQKAEEVNEDFHPRYNAKQKTYKYNIYNAEFPLPQQDKYAYYYYKSLDVDKMKKAAIEFIGEHDFKGFCSSGSSVSTTVRTIYDCKVKLDGKLISVEVTGNGFLYNMVRIIAGTLIDVGNGKINYKDISQIIKSRDRTKAGKTAPAKGLSLVSIEY
jgi:tRNA pseudouridine38-40 synthase